MGLIRRVATNAISMSQPAAASAFKAGAMRAVMGANIQMRSFANFAEIEKGQQKLQKALEKEIKYENENYQQLEDIDQFLTESGFSFGEDDDGISMRLTKSIGDRLVEVQFDAR